MGEVVFEGVFFRIVRERVREFDGVERVYEYAERPDTVAVLVTTPQGVLLVEEEQPRAVRHASLVFGKVDPGEKPCSAAVREAREELGVKGVLEWVFTLQPCGKHVRWQLHQFILRHAEVCCAQALEGGERITPRLVSYDTFFSLLEEKRLGWETLQHGLLFLLRRFGRERVERFLKGGDEALTRALRAWLGLGEDENGKGNEEDCERDEDARVDG